MTINDDDRARRTERLATLHERRADFPDRSRPFETLAEAIVWCAKLPAETLVLEAVSRARRPMADVAEDEEQLREQVLEQARASALDLENGLRLARAAAPNELTLDSRDPAADRIAGAMITVLVASNYATVRTEELGDEQYQYTIAVDWYALDDLAGQIGLEAVTRLLDRHLA